MGGFKKFLFRGNLIDLAVAVVVGTAFTKVVTAIVVDLITPVIGALGKQPNFANLTFTINSSKFAYGNLLNAVLTFLIIAAVVYFLVVVPLSRASARFSKVDETLPLRECPECLSNIPAAATRCMYCTSQSAPAR